MYWINRLMVISNATKIKRFELNGIIICLIFFEDTYNASKTEWK